MFEAYSVAVKLTLINSVSSGLLMISKHLQTTGQDVDKLNAKISAIGKQAAIGGAMFAGGLGIAAMFKGPLDNAIKYQQEMSKLRQQGLGAEQIADAKKFAEANKIIGTSLMDRTKLFTDAQGAFRESGMTGLHALDAAKVMMPVLAKYQVATGLLSEGRREMAHSQFQNMNKTVELMGGLNDAMKAAQIADGIFKTVQSSGRMVSERDLRMFMSYGGVAVSSLTPKTIFAGLEPIIGELSGSTVATGLQTAYNRTHGMMALTPSIMANEALRLGIWDADKVTRTKGGGARFLHGSPMTPALARLMDTDTIAFAQAMLDLYKKKGITALNDIGRENSILFGRTGGAIYTRIMQQMPVLLRSEQAYDKALGINQTIDSNKDAPTLKVLQYHKALDDLSLAIGNNLLPIFTPLITSATNFALELSKHPRLIMDVTYALAGLSAFLIGGGLINMVIAAGRGFWLLGGALRFLAVGGIERLLPVVARLGTYFVMFVGDFVKAGLMFARSGFLQGFLQAFVSPVKLLLGLVFTPIGAIVAGVAVAALLVWNNWKEISGALKVVWADIKGGFIKLFNGDIMGGLKSFAHAYLLGWQTIFNTLIAGLNTILPAAMQLSKTHFADDWPGGGRPAGAGTLVVPVPPKQNQPIEVRSSIILDGKKVGESVSMHQAREASKPRTGTQGFDPTRSMILPGTPSTAYPRG